MFDFGSPPFYNEAAQLLDGTIVGTTLANFLGGAVFSVRFGGLLYPEKYIAMGGVGDIAFVGPDRTELLPSCHWLYLDGNDPEPIAPEPIPGLPEWISAGGRLIVEIWGPTPQDQEPIDQDEIASYVEAIQTLTGDTDPIVTDPAEYVALDLPDPLSRFEHIFPDDDLWTFLGDARVMRLDESLRPIMSFDDKVIGGEREIGSGRIFYVPRSFQPNGRTAINRGNPYPLTQYLFDWHDTAWIRTW